MSNSNGQIKAPVNIAADLGYVLGTGSGDLGYNIANGNINKWAVFKPVRSSEIGWVSPRNTLASLGFASIPAASSIADLIAYYSQADNGWAYQRPRGRTYSEYYRAADFCKIVGSGTLDDTNYGYTHYARNPFGANFSALPSVVSQSADYLYVQQGRITPSGDYPDNELTIYDFNQILNSSLRMKYYGCVIKGYSGSASSIAARLFGSDTDFTSSAARGKEELEFTLTINPTKFQTRGGYIVYPCISNYALSDNGTTMTSGQRLYPIPGATPAVFEVIEDYIVITPYATVMPYTSGSSYNVQWSFQITNYYDTAITLTDVAARFRLPGKSFNDTMQSGEVEVTIGTVNIEAGATYYYPGQGLSTTQNLTNFNLDQLIVGARYNAALKTGTRTFIAPAPNI